MQRDRQYAAAGRPVNGALFTACLFNDARKLVTESAGEERNSRLTWISRFIAKSDVCALHPVHPSIHPSTVLFTREEELYGGTVIRAVRGSLSEMMFGLSQRS